MAFCLLKIIGLENAAHVNAFLEKSIFRAPIWRTMIPECKAEFIRSGCTPSARATKSYSIELGELDIHVVARNSPFVSVPVRVLNRDFLGVNKGGDWRKRRTIILDGCYATPMRMTRTDRRLKHAGRSFPEFAGLFNEVVRNEIAARRQRNAIFALGEYAEFMDNYPEYAGRMGNFPEID